MLRTLSAVVLSVVLWTVNVGCNAFFETRAINQFTAALEKKDVNELKEVSSPEFQKKTLRRSESINDFDLLHLPTGKATVLSMKDGDNENERVVTVEVGKKKKELRYRLVKNGKNGKWKIDDIIVRQAKRGSVTEQMDLLISVREFLDAWENDNRKVGRRRQEKIVATVTPELGQAWQQLPALYRERLAKNIVAFAVKNKKIDPSVKLNGDNALVELSRPAGRLEIVLQLIDDQWKVSDIALKLTTRKGKPERNIRSLLKTVMMLKTAASFLQAYRASDKKTLQKICTQQLYKEGLSHADLKSFPLNFSQDSEKDYTLTAERHSGYFMLRNSKQWLQISLKHPESQVETVRTDGEIKTKKDRRSPIFSGYRVESVTVHRLADHQKIRLSSYFAANVVVQQFASHLAMNNLQAVRSYSTRQFKNQVWQIVDQKFLRVALPESFARSQPRILKTQFKGNITEVHVQQGRRKVIYVLNNREGRVRVDDILIPEADLPDSLRERLTLQLAIYRFTEALRQKKLKQLQRYSSKNFNRLVWGRAKIVPAAGLRALDYLQKPITSVFQKNHQVVVIMDDGQRGAKITLVNEGAGYVVDNTILVTGLQSQPEISLLNTLKSQIIAANRSDSGNGGSDHNVLPARWDDQRTAVSPWKNRSPNEPHGGLKRQPLSQPQAPSTMITPNNNAFRNEPRPLPPLKARPLSPRIERSSERFSQYRDSQYHNSQYHNSQYDNSQREKPPVPGSGTFQIMRSSQPASALTRPPNSKKRTVPLTERLRTYSESKYPTKQRGTR